MRFGLQVQLLGGFNLIYAGAPVTTVNTPRLQSLLTYLILHREAPQPRRYLAYLFWSGSSEAQACTNLRNLVYLLRRVLPDAGAYLCVNDLTIQWQPESPFSLDVADFESAVAHGNLEGAVALYQGDLFPGYYDDWIVTERERLHQLFIVALERLIQQTENGGDCHTALEQAHRLLRHDRLREETYRHMMRLHARSGDRGGVVRIYDTCADILRRELGIEPSPETRRVYEHSLNMPASLSPVTTPGDSGSNNLPFRLTTFIGREREKAEIGQLLSAHRLVTLTGAGGVGKTRLALALAADLLGTFTDGVRHVDLAPLSDPAQVVPAVASVLGVREEGDTPLPARLADYLRPRHLLLILDNCEHLLEAVRQLMQTLSGTAPNLRILATSRTVPGVEGEVIRRVLPLATPELSPWISGATDGSPGRDPVSALRQYESVQLFVDRVVAVNPTFVVTERNAPAVGQICRKLDGIPLALELAAARVNLLTVQQIADRLDDTLHLLAQTNPICRLHHRTMQATMDWSYALLSAKEQSLFRRLSVFAGSFTLEAVEFIGNDDGIEPDQVLDLLSGLADKSLVTVEPSGETTRFRLHEVVRQYARTGLTETGETERIRNRHLDFFCRLAESMEPKLLGAEQATTFNQLDKEDGNLWAALEWSATEGDIEQGLRLAAALPEFWGMRGYLTRGRDRLENLLDKGGTTVSAAVRAGALRGLGYASGSLGDFELACSFLEQSLVLDRELGNKPGLADTLQLLGLLAGAQMEWGAARVFLEENLAVYRDLGNRHGIARVLNELGYVIFRYGEHASGYSLIEESLALYGELGEQHRVARAGYLLGHMASLEGNYALARSQYTGALTVARRFGSASAMFYIIGAFGSLAAAEKQFERAARLFGATERINEVTGISRVPVERVDYDRAVTATRAALGEPAFAVARAAGRAMTSAETVTYALEETG